MRRRLAFGSNWPAPLPFFLGWGDLLDSSSSMVQTSSRVGVVMEFKVLL